MDVTTNAGDAMGALGKMQPDLDNAIRQATTYVGGIAATEMANLIKGRHPRGTKTPSPVGSPPTNITGNLRRSINSRVTGFNGKYTATVGANMVYARTLEFGGENWAEGVRYPFVAPTATLMTKNNQARNIFINYVRTVLFKNR